MRPVRVPALVLCLWACTAPGPPAAAGAAAEVTARVAEVIDGDTVVLASGRLVRYIGIDAPEVRRRVRGRWVLDPEPHALAATDLNRRLVEGRTVRLRYDRERTDRYGRTLAYVFVGDTFVNRELVREGWARAHAYPPNLLHRDELERAEALARREGKGIWTPQEASRSHVD